MPEKAGGEHFGEGFKFGAVEIGIRGHVARSNDENISKLEFDALGFGHGL